jgi:hypothetical protein
MYIKTFIPPPAPCQAVIYQIRKVLKQGSPELVDSLRRGDIPVKTAYKQLGKELEKAV